MTSTGTALFATSMGCCAIVWSAAGVVGIHLPERTVQRTRSRVAERHPGAVEAAPPQPVRQAADAITEHLAGNCSDLRGIQLDMGEESEFGRQVYEAARVVSPGTTVSYGELARRMGRPGSARAVGQALARNRLTVVVPCHRVLAAGGKIGGFSAGGGTDTKRRILEIEWQWARTRRPPLPSKTTPVASRRAP